MPVDVSVPASGDEVQRHRCTAHFRLLDRAAAAAAAKKGDVELVRAVLAGWDGVEDHKGAPLPFSDKNLDRLANITHFANAVIFAYSRWASGLPGKTSKQPPGTGGTAPEAASR